MAGLFTTLASATVSLGASLWVDLGLIPTGYKIWIGTASYTSNYKPVTFTLRTNNATKNTGTTTTTTALNTWTSSSKAKTTTADLYKSGALHTVTVLGSGVEHWWLQLASKTSTAQPVSYSIYYTLE